MRRRHLQEMWLGLACLLPIAATGCQAVSKKVSPKSLDAASAQAQPTDERSPFPQDVAPSQEIGVHLDLARAFESQGNFEAAVVEYQKAVAACDGPGRHGDGKVTPKQQALAHRRMAAALDRLGKFAQAETHYRQALKCSPNDAMVWNDAGYSYYLQHRWADAERSLMTAAKIDPVNPRIQTNLGLSLAAAGKTEAALAALTKAGGPVVAQANLGYILAATGKTQEARKHYQKALELQPQFEAARFALAKLDAGPARPVTPTMPGTALVAAPQPVSTTPAAPNVIQASAPIVLGAPPAPSGVKAPVARALPINEPKPLLVGTPVVGPEAHGSGGPALVGPIGGPSPSPTSPARPPVTASRPAGPPVTASRPAANTPRTIKPAPAVATSAPSSKPHLRPAPRALPTTSVAGAPRRNAPLSLPTAGSVLGATNGVITLTPAKPDSGPSATDRDLTRASADSSIPLPGGLALPGQSSRK